ncbi:MAG TPA: HAMP domain-containing protein [Candidatus Fimadaptatus faecigallinarum]|uniref:histidine kinase n=1 Tax=Candidatus Fimadaptatus faecigallinarum TaxID=2840814 RepID=A0A9D1S3U6_9FIRM|nr:HAMP domain-containing protein [Candidatus Fimadaptatus faecigallinarum]
MRWKLLLLYLLIIGVAFYVVAASLIQLVGDYMFSQRVQEEQRIAEELAISVASDLADQDAGALYESAVTASREYGGRVLVLDAYGTVQADAFSQLNGARLEHPEVVAVLSGEKSSAYSFYKETQPSGNWLLSRLGFAGDASIYGLYASSIVSGDKVIGVLLYSVNEQELYSRLTYMQTQMVYWLIGVALVTLLMVLLLSRMVTKPIKALSEGIEHMSVGDFSHRVIIRGHSEYAQLAAAFNMMSEKLENLDRSRSQFVSNASHELKTPLATMKILIESLIYQDTFEPEMTREFLTDINKEIDRLNSVIVDLLTLVNMDSGEMRLRLGDLQLDEMLADTVKRLTPLARNREINLTLEAHAAPVVEGDASKIQQVFYNLIDNAIKYTPAGGRVRVELGENARSAIIKVSDTGIGIPAADIAHIFDRFYRVDKARSRETGGTGLGLSIVSQIVQLHGGTINVQSVEDKGSVFTVTLPK